MKVLAFASDRSRAAILEHSLKLFKYDYEILPVESWGGLGQKFTCFKQLPRDYHDGNILFIDAFDSILVAGPDELDRVYEEEYSGKIVFGGESNCWPNAHVHQHFDHKDSKWRYLNAGVTIGNFQVMYDLIPRTYSPVINDQAFWTGIAINTDIVEVDATCSLIQNTIAEGHTRINGKRVGLPREMFNIVNGRLLNTENLAMPIIVHAPDMASFDIIEELHEAVKYYVRSE